jgi:hypothetical protein
MYLEPEMVMPMFLGTAVVFVVLSFSIVLLVRAAPAKLMLLGVVTMAAGICFAAFNPVVATAALVTVTLGAFLVVMGLVCALVSYVVGLFVSAKKPAGGKSQPCSLGSTAP